MREAKHHKCKKKSRIYLVNGYSLFKRFNKLSKEKPKTIKWTFS